MPLDNLLMVYYTICVVRGYFMENINVILEIGATISGIIQGLLVMLNKRSNWIFYNIQIVLLFFFSAINKLYGDMVNNLVFIFMGIYAIVMWNRGDKNLPITTLTKLQKSFYGIALITITTLVAVILYHTSDPLPIIDAFTTMSAFFATWFMANKKLEAWILWVINDIVYVVEYAILPEPAYYLLGLNVVWTVMAILSYINWKKLTNQRSDDEKTANYTNTDWMHN